LFHGWDDVGISRDEDYAIRSPLFRHLGNVEPKTHVDPFLFKIWLEIFVC